MEKSNRFSLRQSQNKSKHKSSNKKDRVTSSQKFVLPKIFIQRISDSQEAIQIPFQFWVDPIKSYIKSKGAKWCPVFKFWILPRVDMQSVKKQLPLLLTAQYELPPTFIDIISQQQLKEYLIINKEHYSKKPYKMQQHPLYDKLYPFQRETISFCLQHHGRILIADEMGVGKSIQALACCYLYTQQFPVLIICPSPLKHVWKDQVGKWFKSYLHKEQVIIIKKSNIKQNELKGTKIIIVSYEVAAKLTHELDYIRMVICDEAHYLKNPDTNRCEQLVPFLMNKKRIFLLTGTPLMAKPKEIFNILKILRPDTFKNIYDFGHRYCYLKNNPWNNKLEFDSSKNLGELHYILKKFIMIRRLKVDVLPELPSKQRQIIYMQTEKSVIKQIKETMGNKVSLDNIRNSEKILSLFDFSEKAEDNSSIMRCYLLTAMAKIQSIKEYIGSIIQNDAKIIIFAHHKVVMDQLQTYLKSLRVLFIRLDGSVSAQTRKKKVNNFQDQYEIKVALLSITAMGVGFTLTAASTVIFAQLHWTPANLIQAQDRTHRIGQKNAVNIHYLIGEGTLDPLMLRHLERKVDTIGKVMNAQKQTLNFQQIPKGQLGRFEIGLPEAKNSKGSKITDYFIPMKTKQKNPNSQSQSVKDQTIETSTQRLDDQKSQNEQSQDQSMFIQLLRKRKLQLLNVKRLQDNE